MAKIFGKVRRIHFIGIGGSGMCGIAELLLNLGYIVSGSDIVENEKTLRLTKLGGQIFLGHKASNVEGAEVLVVSSAVDENNVEVRMGREKMIPVIPRAEMLAELMRLKYGIAVAGAHGKTTTTSLIATMLGYGGLDPTAVIGGKLKSFESNARLGRGEILVAEADESDGSFLKLSPIIIVVTNLDMEHMDHYGSMKAIKDAFLTFINKAPFYGVAIICLDEPNLQSIIPSIKTRYITYGKTSQADVIATEISNEGWDTSFNVTYKGAQLGRFTLSLPGEHNVYNALASIAVCMEMDMDIERIRESLKTFSGIERRLELKAEKDGIRVFDDYGHHPTEIIATLKAMKRFVKGRLLVIFQPHRYTRTRDHMDNFACSFNEADHLYLLDIYSAGEKPIEGISSEILAKRIKESGHHNVYYYNDSNELIKNMKATARKDDAILTLGAGNVWKLAEQIL